MSGNADKAKDARDTLSSIYSYAANQDTVENVPSFISSSSGDIPIAVQIPSAEQTEELKKHLKMLIETQEAIAGISERDRRLMIEAADASTIKRRENKQNKQSGTALEDRTADGFDRVIRQHLRTTPSNVASSCGHSCLIRSATVMFVGACMSHQLLDSISLSEGQKKEVCNDMCSFLNAQSVLALALVGKFSLDIYTLSLTGQNMSDDELHAGINREEMRALQQKDSVRQNNQVSLSSLLNAINGVSSSDGRVLVMITNCQDQLDAALIHSGCVDKKVKFTLMLMKQIQSIFQHMYIHEGHTNPAEMAAEFAKHDDSTSTVREAQEQFTTKE
ncbi:hypothetical protein BDDG_13342 [Blastomyces dermatitidis ATCC 18188]|uniref:ATPase AAA-type core domain-containing protein n=1 Tax=Ajellomyces dermatitidis (strain ATCC 18188 / CBS 674.68) TaxID=653446 RepID=A0A0J9ESC4_AJEDA|nr:hypothetical protein BDDG_13342 [Blastomyces dermatitidis ATCC 18188]